MKFIGQYIQSFIARFRSDVYLEDIDTGTIASGGNLGLDSNNKIVKATVSTSVTDLHNAGVDGANNQLLTDDGDGTITSEANLTFDGSILNVTGVADISPSSSAGAAALTIDNDDVDQIALDINASNTTANVIDINAQALTTGKAIFIDCNSLETFSNAIFIDVDDAQTTTNVKNLSQINYDKSGVTATGHGHYVIANAVVMTDAATNDTGGYVQHKAYTSHMSAASGDGNVSQISFKSDVTGGDDAYYAYGGNSTYRGNVGFFSDSSGSDFIAVNPSDHGDYFEIATGAAGATTLTTVDDEGTAAHFEIEADGNITLDAAGDIALEAAGGDVTGDADNYTFSSSTSGKPLLTLKATNTTKDASSELRFQKDANNTEDSEFIGQISFYGENNAGTPETLEYGRVIGYMADQIDGQEAGGLQISVAAYDGVLTQGLLINGNTNADDEVDVTIGSGAASTTTITGSLELGHATDTTLARSASGVVTIEGNQVVTAGATNVASGSQEPIGMQIARRTITQAEMNDLHNTPIAIVPALGANLVAIPVGGTVFVDRAVDNTVSAQLVIGYGSAAFANSIYFFKRFHWNVSTDFHYGMDMYVGNWGTSMTAGVNTAINASANIAYTNNAFTSVDVYINYYVIDRS